MDDFRPCFYHIFKKVNVTLRNIKGITLTKPSQNEEKSTIARKKR